MGNKIKAGNKMKTENENKAEKKNKAGAENKKKTEEKTKDKTKVEKYTMGACIGVLIILAFTIAVRFLTRQILIEYYGIDNGFTRLVWFDNAEAAAAKSNGETSAVDNNKSSYSVEINWEELYPFNDSDSNIEVLRAGNTEGNMPGKWRIIANAAAAVRDKTDHITDMVKSIEEKIETYTSDMLVFRSEIVEAAYSYEKIIGWNFASFGEYNGVVELADGYLSSYVEKKDTSQQFEALSFLNDFCQNKDIDFLYVQAPYKISEYDDVDVSGKLDFSNQNANDLLDKLDAAGIDYYDIRDTIHENNIHNHDLFYKTDHHWLTTTGLWAAQNILGVCNEKYGWNADISLLDSDKFNYKTYKDWFLGSQGRKVTLSICEPDDFTLLYPKYDTKFHYCVPAEGVDAIGDYSVVYNMSQVEIRDYYNKSPYHACNYGDQALVQIENQLPTDGHRILIIHDSFGDCLISCLALAEKNVDSLDIRHFTGSVKTYIKTSRPDLVIVMYNAGAAGGEVDYSTHKDICDFR